jgi:MFS transporter, DHA1 family, inner membrane transport protein
MAVAESWADGAGSVAKKNAARERIVLLILAAVQFTSIVDFMVIMPLFPQLETALGVTPQQFGLIVASYTIAAGIAGFVASSLIDRYSRKAAFLGLYVGFLVGTLFCGLAPSYTTLLLARVVTGAFGGILGGLAMAIVGDVFPDERRGRATGILMSSFSLASVFGVPFGLYLGTQYDWHSPFLMLVALGVPILILGIVFLPPLRDHVGRVNADPWERMVETYSHPNHLRAFALVVAMMLGTFLVVPFISGYLVSNCGLSSKDLPWIFFGGGIASLISSPIVGWCADRFGKLRVYRVIAPFSAIMMIALTNLPKVGLLIAIAAVAMMMVSNSGRMVAALAMINGSVEQRLRGGFMSAYSSVQHISAGVGAYVAGEIVDKGPGGTLVNYSWVGLLGVAATLLSLWLAGRLRPALKPPNPDAEPLDELIETVPAAEAF